MSPRNRTFERIKDHRGQFANLRRDIADVPDPTYHIQLLRKLPKASKLNLNSGRSIINPTIVDWFDTTYVAKLLFHSMSNVFASVPASWSMLGNHNRTTLVLHSPLIPSHLPISSLQLLQNLNPNPQNLLPLHLLQCLPHDLWPIQAFNSFQPPLPDRSRR